METFVLVASMMMMDGHSERFAQGGFHSLETCQRFLYLITVSHLPAEAQFAMGRCMPLKEYRQHYSHLPLGDRDT